MRISTKKRTVLAIIVVAFLVLFAPLILVAQGPAVESIRTISPNVATSSVSVLGANRWRTGFTIYNNSSNSVYLTYGPTSSGSSPTRILASFANFDMFGPAVYRGEISAVRNAGTGNLIITEYIYSN